MLSTAIEELNVGVRAPTMAGPTLKDEQQSGLYEPDLLLSPQRARRVHHGGFVYHGTQFPSTYQGSYFFADYAQNTIKRLTFDANGNVNGVFNFEPANGAPDGPTGDIVH